MLLKRVSERRREKKISKTEGRISKSQNDKEKERLLKELGHLKEENGDFGGAIRAIIERLKISTSNETFEELIDICGKADDSIRRAFSKEIARFAGEFDDYHWKRMVLEYSSEDSNPAIDLVLDCYRASHRLIFARAALEKIEEALIGESGEALSKMKEIYVTVITEAGEISREDQLDLLLRAIHFTRSTIGDEMMYLDFAVKYIILSSVERDSAEVVSDLVERIDRYIVLFVGKEELLLDKLDAILPKIQEVEGRGLLLKKMRDIARLVSDKRYEKYADSSDEANDIEALKKNCTSSELKAKTKDANKADLQILVGDYERLIEALQSPEEKLVYIRKLGTLFRDRLEEYYRALDVFEEGLKLKSDDISLWLVKGMTLEKIARNESDPDKASIFWKKAYDHYHTIAETFEEQEVKLTAIEKCAMIHAERLTGV